MSENGYDTAQICTNGHVINSQSVRRPERNKRFCISCGSPSITNCQNCNSSIQGFNYSSPINYYSRPSFCHECGKPYPWIEAKLKAAKNLSDEFENISPEERETLKKSLDDIVRETPLTPVASIQFKKIVAKVGKVAADGLKYILFDIACEAAKRTIWPS